MSRKIAFQGELGAFSHATAREAFPADEPLPCVTFEQTLGAVQSGEAEYAVVPVENSLYGRITDIHHILPESGLYIIGEHYLPVRMNLLGVPGTTLAEIEAVQSLSVALGQCRKFIARHNLRTINAVDTAGSAREVAEKGDRKIAAIASRFAAETYGLDVIAENIEDESHNTTRFLIMAREPIRPKPNGNKVKTTFVFRVRNVPAALYKAMGGFATNGVNMTKLESYMVGGSFTATQFYADIEGHPDDHNVKLALEELGFFSDHFKLLGIYPVADSAP
ncbi:prephenate dehydratase [Pelagibacterium sp. 26DY04]|uniref:prephenate dehydratase n=1 Tax=unclassified Pelagibacterium TaxID=2623280 RepID=UPI0028161C39|nr:MULTISPECIES: prephenate dehydratase [unclassified Pelagibacterium]WMT87436.1 prephenate dehydratase [Pelagibacterium sp. 26DY04]WMT91759.1 prephenate dehydratase [Pelagibacterium sp. H642]